ncbi:MAG: SusD/RagB family nutrient-binding outer membrane lipoprotein [Bacteroidales bacterium]|nr:SusD/RagB family nutrient-binding outer membrane lipoprotein [Bacteroidales bacterium]
MKKLYAIILGLATLLSLSSCKDWLDVNTDPDNPSNLSATVNNRLPWIQYYYMYAWGTANTRANAIAQMVTGTSRTAAIGLQANWNPAQGISTTVYQNWFLGAACNIPDMITKANEDNSPHYEAAGRVVRAMGFIMMCDFYGEMPYTYAITADFTPSYDNGDVIYAGCLEDIDKAIEIFSQPQPTGAVALSEGDLWCGGDADKWLKLCYGLKARWLNNMSKLSTFDAQEVLDCISKAPTSNAENIIMKHYNVETAGYNFTVGDAYGPNVTYDSMAWGTGQRLTRWYVNLLTNFKGSGVEDPRADKLLPSAMYKVKLNTDGSAISSYEWLRDEGVDAYDPDEGWKVARHVGGNLNGYLTIATADVSKEYAKDEIEKYYTNGITGFVNAINKYYSADNVTVTAGADKVTVVYHPGAMYVNDTNPLYVEDIKYVQLRSDGVFETAGLAVNDMNCYYSGNSAKTRALGFVQGTGAFYSRIDSDSYILTYPEMCFIKAEIYFNQGNKSAAFTAYQDGIKASFGLMNNKLESWTADGCGTTARGFDVSFAYSPIPQADINAYMASAAVVQNSGDLTLSDIMMQKFIAMGVNYQNYNDMRKYNYYADGVYTEMKDPAYRNGNGIFDTNPSSKSHFVRRWQHSTHETNYNSTEVANIYAQYGYDSALDQHIWGIPVFWDK